MTAKSPNKIIYFSEDKIRGISLPERFTFPFYYEPHALTQLAAEELQTYLEKEFSENHNFGLDENQEGLVIGKMFGVLVVQDADRRLGYLSAFSGKLANSNDHDRFVPPVFDMLTENSFFLQEEKVLNQINREIEVLESDAHYINLKSDFLKYSQEAEKDISTFKEWMKERKAERKRIRESGEVYSESELVRESNLDQFKFRMLKESWKQALGSIEFEIRAIEKKIEELKWSRKEKSSSLQNQLFEQYSFINKEGKWKNLGDIFSETVFEKPPAGAGECATPKLLQYAFLHDLKPISFGEFWWGASPKSEVRKHKQFYAACSGKCRPILKHMLEGVELEENLLLKNLAEEKQIKILYEDDHLWVVNKPAELLSVPGIEIQDSVYTRLQEMMGGIEPLIIHRLDMSTSGLLIVAKTKQAHKYIQLQFLKRTVKKRYTALLDGVIEGEEGEINLPLRGNVVDRPRQMVCFENGKKAITKWKVVERNANTTKVHFWPITGRTHQLRVHSAHELGLNSPIVGDDLYGTPANRLHLHAAWIQFTHPVTKELMEFEEKEEF
jgi:tRNA pseudouridine32 synthase/23S rRNA pseudouridine746 synthase